MLRCLAEIETVKYSYQCINLLKTQNDSNASVTRDRSDHRIARLVTNLGDVRLVATTKDQSLGIIYDLPLILFGKMHSMIGCDKIRTVM